MAGRLGSGPALGPKFLNESDDMTPTTDDTLPPPMQEPVGVPPAVASVNETLLAQLARDFLRERRAERRWRTVFRLFWLLLAGVLVMLLFWQR